MPGEAHRWQALEHAFESLVQAYGYREIRTPAFEDTDLFVRSSGETSEVVSKQMYSFVDKGGRDITLKPEGTAPAMRAFLEHSLGGQGVVTRLYYFTQIFRYERPSKGRYRQAHQTGLELVGSPSPAADAEVIEITVRFYEALGLKDISVDLNSIGREETRARYREALLTYAEPYLADFDSDFQAQARKNPLRLLDSKIDVLKAAMDQAPSILDYLEDTSKAHFEELKKLLGEAGIAFRVTPKTVRGLDYYTDTVFEVVCGSLGDKALCGGGRYDNLIAQLGGPATPSVGVAMGVERALMAMEAEGLVTDQPGLDAFLVAATESARTTLRGLARDLRAVRVRTGLDLDGKSLRSQMKQADREKARLALILGDDELARGEITLRDLEKGDQVCVALEAAVDAVRSRLG